MTAKRDASGDKLVRAQITRNRLIAFGELCIYEQYCTGGKFYDRFRLADKDDFNGEIE